LAVALTPSSEGAGASAHAIVGRVRRAHGVRGEVVVELLTDAPDAIFAPGARVLAGTIHGDVAPDGASLRVEGARPFKEGLLVHFEEILDRNVADTWRDRYLLVPVEELEPLADDEVYLHDLVGLRVELADGTAVGTVSSFYELSHGILLEVQRVGAAGGSVLVPYRDEFVTAVDVRAGRLVIDPPTGLLE